MASVNLQVGGALTPSAGSARARQGPHVGHLVW